MGEFLKLANVVEQVFQDGLLEICGQMLDPPIPSEPGPDSESSSASSSGFPACDRIVPSRAGSLDVVGHAFTSLSKASNTQGSWLSSGES